MKKLLVAMFVFILNGGLAQAAVKTKAVTYEFGGITLKGHLAWDDAQKGKRPGVLVVHEWWGLNDYAKKRAEQLAGMGYVAFAADMYGEGKVVEHPKDAGQMAGEVRKDAKVWQGRALAALKILQDNEMVDAKKIAGIGYCFGGSTVLQLAFTGADVAAVVSFHGSLQPPTPEQAKSIKAKIMVCHGALDTFIPDEAIVKFRTGLEEANANYQIIYYSNAVHSFTVPGADQRGLKGIGYNADADRRSWQHMQGLFNEVFAGK
ncbi:MAG: dienelactone hydrolase family protein [Gemmataceae bacterium]|nr:dienelactone hydrolase family protein [Gemmataceae bacterium]MCI0742997.1 dienelactone hydrolase family protein [Gemmataceae bacterium]